MFLRNYLLFQKQLKIFKTHCPNWPHYTQAPHIACLFFFKSYLWTSQIRTASIFSPTMFNLSIFSSPALQKHFVEQLHFQLNSTTCKEKKKSEYKFKAIQTQTLVHKHLDSSFSKNGRSEWTTGNMNYSVQGSQIIHSELHESLINQFPKNIICWSPINSVSFILLFKIHSLERARTSLVLNCYIL